MASLRARCAVGVAVASVVTVATVAVAVRTLRPLGVADASTTQLWITVALVAVVSGAAAIGVALLALRERGDQLARLAVAMESLARNSDVPDGTLTALPAPGERSPIEQTVADLQERQQLALGAERAASDRYRAMIDTVASSVFAIDGGGRIIATNTAAAAMFGRTRDTMLGSLLFDLVAAESLHMAVDELGTVRIPALTSDAGVRFSTSVRRFGQPTFPAEVAIAPLVLDWQQAWAVCVEDLTQVRDAAAVLDEARAAEDVANRSRTRFLGNMSRQVRASLTLMISHSRKVRRSRHSTLGERDGLHLDRVQETGESLLLLVNDILDFTRMESGGLTLAMTQTDIVPIVNDVVAEFEPKVAGRPVLLETTLPSVEVLATVDAIRLRQILVYLVGNAVKFTARGSVNVSVILDHVTGCASAILIRDTGIGIPLDRQSNIFAKFEQASSNIGSRYGGAGLGLSLSRRIASQMGCALSVESMPGAGSTFTLAFVNSGVRGNGAPTVGRPGNPLARASTPA